MRFFRHITCLLLIAGLAILSTPVLAQGADDHPADRIMVTRHFTGIWDQVDQQSQGIALQVVEQLDDSRRAVAYWYTYGDDRKTAWYIGIGDLVANRVEMELFESTDVGFMQEKAPGVDPVNRIGTMTITFESCQIGEVSFETNQPEVGSGSFRIERLLEVMNTHCSGGISDDMHADAMFGAQVVELTASRNGITGDGYARYEDFPGHSEFTVHVQGLPDGDYRLFVGTEDRGALLVSGGSGELRFASPAEDGKMMLNFDPRGVRIEVRDAEGAILSSFDELLEMDYHHHAGMGGSDGDHNFDCEYGPGSGHGMGGMEGMHHCVDDGDSLDIRADLDATAALPGARGSAVWDMNSSRIQFSVEIENVPAGLYTLNVGGENVGVIEAVQMHFGVYGHIAFRDPESYGMRHLDFEPRGETIRVLQEDSVILEADFPVE
jgi:hypothetical protein